MRCSGAVLLRARRNGGRYCTCRSTVLPTRPAWSTAQGARAADQRGLAVRRRDWPAAAEPPRESLTFAQKISTYSSAIKKWRVSTITSRNAGVRPLVGL